MVEYVCECMTIFAWEHLEQTKYRLREEGPFRREENGRARECLLARARCNVTRHVERDEKAY